METMASNFVFFFRSNFVCIYKQNHFWILCVHVVIQSKTILVIVGAVAGGDRRDDPIKIACLLLMFPASFISTPARWEHQVRHATMNLLT